MRKIFTTGMLLTIILTSSCSSDEKDVTVSQRNLITKSLDMSIDQMPVSDPPEGSVKTVWTIGQKSKKCHGVGICSHVKTTIKIGKLPPYTYPAPPYPTSTSAYSDVLPIDQNTFWIEFDDFSTQNIKDSFGGEFITLDEDFIIDENVVGIDIANDFVIAAGTYKLQKRSASGLYGIIAFNAN